jgi:carbohydrate-binding DOMON domain-containing protein
MLQSLACASPWVDAHTHTQEHATIHIRIPTHTRTHTNTHTHTHTKTHTHTHATMLRSLACASPWVQAHHYMQ